MARISVLPCSSRWVAKLWRSACSVTSFLIPAAAVAAWNRRVSWRVLNGWPRRRPGNSQRSCAGRSVVIAWTHFPPLAQQGEHLGREHDVTVLAALGLLDPNDVLRAIDILDLQSDHLAGAQAGAIAETKQHAGLRIAGNRQQSLDLVRAHHQRNLLRRTDVINLSREVEPPQRHTQQEPHPGHDPVAVTDAHAHFGQVKLEAANVLGCGRVGGALEKGRKPLAAADVTPLRVRTQLARGHVLDHPLAQRADNLRTHRQLLSWMRLTTPRSLRPGELPAIDALSSG